MSKAADALRLYSDRRLVAILAMGFASGLPLALTGATLAIWLKEDGISLTAIGLFAQVGLSYNLKFLWAWIVDGVQIRMDAAERDVGAARRQIARGRQPQRGAVLEWTNRLHECLTVRVLTDDHSAAVVLQGVVAHRGSPAEMEEALSTSYLGA